MENGIKKNPTLDLLEFTTGYVLMPTYTTF